MVGVGLVGVVVGVGVVGVWRFVVVGVGGVGGGVVVVGVVGVGGGGLVLGVVGGVLVVSPEDERARGHLEKSRLKLLQPVTPEAGLEVAGRAFGKKHDHVTLAQGPHRVPKARLQQSGARGEPAHGLKPLEEGLVRQDTWRTAALAPDHTPQHQRIKA